MRSRFEPAASDAPAATRIVLLPGAYHSSEDLLQAGFLDAVRARRKGVDLEFVDLELRHLRDHEAVERLRGEVVQPARARGCAAIWLAGTSLGGYLALDYASRHPGDIRGVCLLAPFLGDRRVIAEIERAGGLGAWRSDLPRQPGLRSDEDMDLRIWRFLQTRGTGAPLVYLGCGREDRYAFAHRLLADGLAPGASHFIAGGHDLATWRTLWEKFLDGAWL